MDQIFINDLHVQAVIGITDEERSHDRDILINIVLYTDVRIPAKSDRIEDCVNYASVAEKVQQLVKMGNRWTVEALASDISKLCLDFHGVTGVKVRLEKPGAVRFTHSVGVEIERFKD